VSTMGIDLETALRLWPEAHQFTAPDNVRFLAVNSEIRTICHRVFNRVNTSLMQHVCAEIFRVVSEHYVTRFTVEVPSFGCPVCGWVYLAQDASVDIATCTGEFTVQHAEMEMVFLGHGRRECKGSIS
jgi:hypothetical protein